jgi:hypothetical protein
MDIRGQEPGTVWQRLKHHEIKVVFAHDRRAGCCRAGRVRVRRRGRRPDCAGEWQYDPADITDYWPGAGQFGPGDDGSCQYHDTDDRDD